MKSSDIDRMTQASGVMNHYWVVLFSNDALREAAGLRYISHMVDERPYWYLWHAGCAGVYELDLLGAQAIDGYDWLAEFAVRYYPGTKDPHINPQRRKDLATRSPAWSDFLSCRG